MAVGIAIADLATQDHQRVIQHRSIAFGPLLELIHQIRKLLHPVASLRKVVAELALRFVLTGSVVRRLMTAHVKLWIVHLRRWKTTHDELTCVMRCLHHTYFGEPTRHRLHHQIQLRAQDLRKVP